MRLTVIFILLGFVIFSQAQNDPVDFRCTAVNPDNSVTLSWIKPPDPTGFINYQVYYATQVSGPYNPAGPALPDFNTESFTHSTVDPVGNNLWYFITAQYSSGPANSDTFRTIRMLSNPLTPENIRFIWNHIANPRPPSAAKWYRIYLEYPPGNWTLIDSIQDNDYEYYFGFCNENLDPVNFRVEQDDASGCTSVSSVTSQVLYNYVTPSMPVLDSVSVTEDGQVIIGWKPNPEADIGGYVIYLVTGVNTPFDTVFGGDITTYIHQGADPCSGSLTYAISAIDSCNNESPGTFFEPQRTLLIESIVYDPCLLSNTISWNEYVNFDPPVETYKLYASENGGPFELIQTLDASQRAFEHSDLLPNSTYEYYVRAVSGDGIKSSRSCVKAFTTYDSPRPDYLYLRQATVVDNDHVDIFFYTDTSTFVNLYRIFRSESPSGPFAEIGTVTPTAEETLSFTDSDAAINERSFYYKITVIDSCGIESEIGNLGRTVFLTVRGNPDLTNLLEWNAYQSWDGSVESYEIFRIVDGVPDPQGVLATVAGTELSYLDDLSGVVINEGVTEYYVRAVESGPNSFGFTDDAYSNIAAAFQETSIFVPNAFAPEGINRTFKPVATFVSRQEYLFQVYSRFGQIIFETGNPSEGWDGTVDGNLVPQGVYVYLIRYRDTRNQPYVLKGTVTVVF